MWRAMTEKNIVRELFPSLFVPIANSPASVLLIMCRIVEGSWRLRGSLYKYHYANLRPLY
jgi:hypothetical protein